jgi:ADP-heptose:LPS heptosyltransferase
MKLSGKLKNFFIIFLLRCIRLFQKKAAPFDELFPRILLVSTTALGDTLWATPAIESIRKKYKNGFIACLCSKTAFSVLEKNENINKLFLIKNPLLLSFVSLFFALKKENFHAVIILHSSQRLTLPLCYLINPSILAATEGINKGLDSLLSYKTQKIFQHEIDRRFDLLKAINVEKFTTKMTFYFEEDSQFIQNELIEKITRPLIIFHPGAKDFFRVWHKSSYSRLGKMLYDYFGCTIGITGSKNEAPIILEIAKEIPFCKTYIGTLSLNKLATLYKNADVVITGDTGPLHLACALETKVIALFAATDPKKFGPYNLKNGVIIKKPQICSPCISRKCKNPKCFLQITPEEVFNTCKILLK